MSGCGVDIRDAFFDEVYRMASMDRNILFMTADADAFSLRKFMKDLPAQFINVGVAEQNMVAVAGGLALSGKKVFIYGIIPFLAFRCLEHIKVNICGMNLPVVIVGAGAGLSFGFDGPTHHAIQDVAVMRTLPEMTILNPSDGPSSESCARLVYWSDTSVYVRIDKGTYPDLYSDTNDADAVLGLKQVRAGGDVVILSTGMMTHKAVLVAEALKKIGTQVGVADVCRIKPLNTEQIRKIVFSARLVVTIEENAVTGGLGSAIGELLLDHGIGVRLKRIAMPDVQCYDYGDREWLHRRFGLDVEGLTETIRSALVQI